MYGLSLALKLGTVKSTYLKVKHSFKNTLLAAKYFKRTLRQNEFFVSVHTKCTAVMHLSHRIDSIFFWGGGLGRNPKSYYKNQEKFVFDGRLLAFEKFLAFSNNLKLKLEQQEWKAYLRTKNKKSQQWNFQTCAVEADKRNSVAKSRERGEMDLL